MGKRKRGRSKDPSAPVTTSGFDGPDAWLLGRRWLASLVAFVGLLALYVATLAPSVMGGDSGELTAAALTGGVPHPPGYPLFAMLARFFGWLPLGHSPAWRVNLLSAVSTAGAAAMLCATAQLWTRQAAAGLVAAALFGTNAVVWRHATSAEVFGLNVLLVATAFFLWLSIERGCQRASEADSGRRTIRWLVFGLFLTGGLAMANHHTFVFLGAPLALRALWVARRQLGGKGIALAFACGLLGLAPYAYLVVASGSQAAVVWGDETTLSGFLTHVLRRAYGTFSMGHASKGSAFVAEGTFFATLWRMLGHAVPRFCWIGVPLALLGFYGATRARRERGLVYFLGFLLGGYIFAFSAMSNLAMDKELYVTVLSRFTIQSDLLFALAAGLGFAWLVNVLGARLPVLDRQARWAAPACAVLLFGTGVLLHGKECNQRNNRVFADFVTAAFASLPPNAIVITMGDHLTGSVFYFREVERLRADIIHLDRELLGYPWYGERKRRLHPNFHLPDGVYGRRGWKIKKLLDSNPDRPLVVIDRLETWDESWKDGYKLATNGLVHPLVPAAQFPSFEEWLVRDRRAIGGYDVMPALRSRDGSWEKMLAQLALTAQAGRAHLSLVYSTDAGNAPAPARTAVALLEDIIAKAGGDQTLNIPAFQGLPPLVTAAAIWKDLGIGYEILSRVDAAYTPRIAIAFEKFIERAEKDDKDLPAARAYVEKNRRP